MLTGPATDNEVGRDYITAELRLPAHNALRDAEGLVGVVRDALTSRRRAQQRPVDRRVGPAFSRPLTAPPDR